MQCDDEIEIEMESMDGVELSLDARCVYENQLSFLISMIHDDFDTVDIYSEQVSTDDDGDLCVYLPMRINDHLSIKLEVCRIGLGHWRWMGETVH